MIKANETEWQCNQPLTVVSTTQNQIVVASTSNSLTPLMFFKIAQNMTFSNSQLQNSLYESRHFQITGQKYIKFNAFFIFSSKIWPEVIKFFMFNSAEHEFFPAHKS